MIKIGIVGTGYWGKHHLRVFSGLNCDLVGIADLDPSKKELAKSFNVKFYTDYKKLIKKIDAVSIVTPPSSHFQIAKKALKRNIHVFIEKPFVLTAKHGKELISLARNKGKVLMVGNIFLFHPALVEMRKIIENKDLGNIYYLISQRLNLGVVRSDVNSLWNFAPHDISMVNYLLNDLPEQVSCIGEKYLQENIEDITFLTLRYRQKILVNIILSWLHPEKVRRLTVVGSKKMAIFDDVDTKYPLKIYDKGIEPQRLSNQMQWDSFGEFKMKIRYGNVVTPQITTAEPLRNEAIHFLDCIANHKNPISNGESGLNILTVLLSATKSLKKGGKPVEVIYKR